MVLLQRGGGGPTSSRGFIFHSLIDDKICTCTTSVIVLVKLYTCDW